MEIVFYKFQNEVIQHNSKAGVITSASHLALQNVMKNQAGNYTCLASNVEGDGQSNSVDLKVMCKYRNTFRTLSLQYKILLISF